MALCRLALSSRVRRGRRANAARSRASSGAADQSPSLQTVRLGHCAAHCPVRLQCCCQMARNSRRSFRLKSRQRCRSSTECHGKSGRPSPHGHPFFGSVKSVCWWCVTNRRSAAGAPGLWVRCASGGRGIESKSRLCRRSDPAPAAGEKTSTEKIRAALDSVMRISVRERLLLDKEDEIGGHGITPEESADIDELRKARQDVSSRGPEGLVGLSEQNLIVLAYRIVCAATWICLWNRSSLAAHRAVPSRPISTRAASMVANGFRCRSVASRDRLGL